MLPPGTASLGVQERRGETRLARKGRQQCTELRFRVLYEGQGEAGVWRYEETRNPVGDTRGLGPGDGGAPRVCVRGRPPRGARG